MQCNPITIASGFTDLRSSISLIVIGPQYSNVLPLSPKIQGVEKQRCNAASGTPDGGRTTREQRAAATVPACGGYSACAAVDPPKSGPRPKTRLLRQPALEGLTNLARTESPQHDDRNKSDHGGGGTAARRWRRRPRGFWGGGAAANLRLEARIVRNHESSTCVTLNGSGIQLAVGPTTIVTPKSQFRTCPTHHATIHMKKIALDNQSPVIRHLRAKLAIEIRESAATKGELGKKVACREHELQLLRNDNCVLQNVVTLYHKDIGYLTSQLVEAQKEYRSNQVGLEASHTTIVGLTEIGLFMSKKIGNMKIKIWQTGESHLECHQKLLASIQEA
ncbi:hypothetical protein F511_37769 [Dorcoceras hygrometricum]|uniref:Uncharacterized protein n=1 Tax=Dorcoceras hygrometricum TaxID=472368 RepID=A0A2Z7BHI2_9LAMI|nr:hypothetical protein F511_37769 [Dorcoceras hygrometricum]